MLSLARLLLLVDLQWHSLFMPIGAAQVQLRVREQAGLLHNHSTLIVRSARRFETRTIAT